MTSSFTPRNCAFILDYITYIPKKIVVGSNDPRQ